MNYISFSFLYLVKLEFVVTASQEWLFIEIHSKTYSNIINIFAITFGVRHRHIHACVRFRCIGKFNKRNYIGVKFVRLYMYYTETVAVKFCFDILEGTHKVIYVLFCFGVNHKVTGALSAESLFFFCIDSFKTIRTDIQGDNWFTQFRAQFIGTKPPKKSKQKQDWNYITFIFWSVYWSVSIETDAFIW